MPNDPLAELRDIHLPSPVSFWPPAPGGWVLALFLLIIIGLMARLLWSQHTKKRSKREALFLLKEMQEQFEFTTEPHLAIRELSQLIRRVVLSSFAREKVASLQGLHWLEFLDKTGNTVEFTQGVGQIFAAEIYQQDITEKNVNLTLLFPMVRKWIKKIQPEIYP